MRWRITQSIKYFLEEHCSLTNILGNIMIRVIAQTNNNKDHTYYAWTQTRTVQVVEVTALFCTPAIMVKGT